jgi:hypothetical protein
MVHKKTKKRQPNYAFPYMVLSHYVQTLLGHGYHPDDVLKVLATLTAGLAYGLGGREGVEETIRTMNSSILINKFCDIDHIIPPKGEPRRVIRVGKRTPVLT